ncbi:MAG: hypothetical protein CVU54_01900 [Deltaproteobacteria bacterium HGW-Deltaproteobacteria-12]|jgi:hypothetical protein|nr:MAG: hypothetical protein CVU54_01900 [Deltaproteobacteria bacterium HGW-Deltaproteobacteria-12]
MSRWLQKPPLGAQIDFQHPLAKGLAGCWIMSEANGLYVNDLSGNGNHGVISANSAFKAGQKGYGVSFDATAGMINCGKRPSLNDLWLNKPATLIYSIRKDGTGQNNMGYLVSKCSSTASPGWRGFDTATTPHALSYGWSAVGSTLPQVTSPANSLLAGHHGIGVVLRNTTDITCFDLYIDGINQAKTFGSGGGTHYSDATEDLTIGNRPPANARTFNGLIYHVYYFARELSPQEIQQLYIDPYCFIQERRKYWLYPQADESTSLTVADSAHSHTSGDPVLTQAQALAADHSAHALASDNVSLSGAVTLIVSDSAHVSSSESPALVQQHTLAIADGTHALVSDNPSLPGAISLSVFDGNHVHSCSGGAIYLMDEQGEYILTEEGEKIIISENDIVLSESPAAGELEVSNGAHALSSGEPALTEHKTLEISDSGHVLTSGEPTLVEHKTLVISDAIHALSSDELSLVIAGQLAVQNASQSLISDAPAIVQNQAISVDAAGHAVISDAPSLIQAYILAIQDSAHLVGSDGVVLTQTHYLDLANALHGVSSDNIVLFRQIYKRLIIEFNAKHGNITINGV